MFKARLILNAGLKLLAFLIISLAMLSSAQARTTAVVPIAPMAWMLEKLAGHNVRIITLIPAGASPHSYELTPRQMAGLSEADVFFTLNLPLERQVLSHLKSSNPHIKAVDLNHGISMRHFSAMEQDFEAGHGHEQHALSAPDPHTWLDPQNAIIQARNMASALEHEIKPEGLQALQQSLRQLDSRLAASLAPFKGQSFLVYHPSFGYLARRYGLKQVAVEMEGKEPTPRRLANLIEQARSRGIKIIFVQPQFPQAAMQRLAEEIQGSVVSLDPLAYDYIANMETMAGELGRGF